MHTHAHLDTTRLYNQFAAMSLIDCNHNAVCVFNWSIRILCLIFVSVFENQCIQKNVLSLIIFLRKHSSVNLNPSALILR